MDHSPALTLLGVLVVVSPLLPTTLLGVSSLLGRTLAEGTTRLVQAAIISGLLAAVAVLAMMLAAGTRHVAINFGNWVAVSHSYHFSIKFVFDRLSVPFAILSFVLSGTIGAFASRYMHRERGFNRFFVLYATFVLGMLVTTLAGTIETLFAGWELVGPSSALLVAFYQERPAPSRNGLWVWCIYRVSDAALLLAAVGMHHLRGEGDFDQLLGSESWPEAHAIVASNQALLVGLLILAAAAGKSALVPFSGWLPRAMEGPTPSSAVFYGALSVHLGAFLLLRCSPLLGQSTLLSAAVVVLGLATAAYACETGSVQTDIKSALTFASLSQVGIIVAEIGLVGLELHTELSLCLWFSAILSLGGFGLTLRVAEARFGRVSPASYHGLYEHAPTLAIFSLPTGLASVGFPGALGFISLELFVDGAVEANTSIGVGVVIASALSGIAVLRAYVLISTGARHASTVFLGTGRRERVAVPTLSALILGGGLYPQPVVNTRERAAEEVLGDRKARGFGKPDPAGVAHQAPGPGVGPTAPR